MRFYAICDPYITKEINASIWVYKFEYWYESQRKLRNEELKRIKHNCFNMPKYCFCSVLTRFISYVLKASQEVENET